MRHGQPRILFLSLSDDTGSERIVSEMGRRGAVCALLGRADAVAAKTRHLAHHRVLPSRGGLWGAAFGAARRLEALAEDWRPDAVVPLDDMAAGLLRDIATAPRTGATLRALLERSLGDPAHYRTACCRAALIDAAASLGLSVPAQRGATGLAEAQAAAAAIGYPVMLKREGTCGGAGVVLVRDPAALAGAFRAADRRARAKRALRRLFGFRPDRAPPLTLQAHVAGQLAMRTVACERGRVLGGLSLAAEELDPPVTGSSTAVRPIDHPEMEETARRMVERLGCSGFVSFDFILAGDGTARLIEMNARPVGTGHLGARFGHDLYGAWLGRFPGFRDAAPLESSSLDAAPARSVALFPKEAARDPASRRVAGPDAAPDILHDVPWDEPRILAHYRERLTRRHPAAAGAIARILAGGEAPAASDLETRARPAAVRYTAPSGAVPRRA